MNARYRVVNRLGLFVAGRRFVEGDEVSLSNEDAAPLLVAASIVQVHAAPKPKAKPPRPR